MNRETKIWSVVIGMGVLLLIGSMLIRGGLVGRAYVRTMDKEFVQIERPIDGTPTDPTASSETEKVWVLSTSPEATATTSIRTSASPKAWTTRENATMSDFNRGEAGIELSTPRTIGIWIAAFLTLCIFSFLYGDNPFYKLAESIFIGVSAAYWMVLQFWSVIVPNLLGKLVPATVQAWAMPGLESDKPELIYIVPLVLAIMLLWRLMPAGQWIARWPLALFIGVFAGLRMVQFIQADFLNQISNGILPLVVTKESWASSYPSLASELSSGPTWQPITTSIWNTISVLGVLACLTYFFFSIEHKGAIGRVARVGTWILMITFGAMFAFTVMGRIALLTGRLEFLFIDWLWLIDPTGTRA